MARHSFAATEPMWILALRDHETGAVLALRPLTDQETEGMADLIASQREAYPPPRYEMMIGFAASIDTFTRLYPRFKL